MRIHRILFEDISITLPFFLPFSENIQSSARSRIAMANLEHKNELDLTKTLSHDLKADIEEGGSAPAKLNRGLQGRHMQMIAIGE